MRMTSAACLGAEWFQKDPILQRLTVKKSSLGPDITVRDSTTITLFQVIVFILDFISDEP